MQRAAALKPCSVANPYARERTYLDNQTRTRRDHTKYLTLIRVIALLHQYQRPETRHAQRQCALIHRSRADDTRPPTVAHEVLGRSLDELHRRARLLLLIDEMVSPECERLKIEARDFRFSRRMCGHTRAGATRN